MSFTRPPRTRTIECSCRLWPSPGMYAVTSMPLVRRTRATLRRAEFGFFGVIVYTRVHTPRRWGAPFRAGVLVLVCLDSRPVRTSWAMVGKTNLSRRYSGQTMLRDFPAEHTSANGSRVVWFVLADA